MIRQLSEDEIRQAEDAHQDQLAEESFADMLAHPESVVDLLPDCPHRTADARQCNGCTVGDPDLNQTGLRWCEDGQVVNAAEQENTCGCALTPAEWLVALTIEAPF